MYVVLLILPRETFYLAVWEISAGTVTESTSDCRIQCDLTNNFFPPYKIALQNITEVLKFVYRNALTVNLYFLVTGHGLWLCKKSKRKNLDVMWHSRIPGTWNNTQQGTLSFRWAIPLM